MAGTRRSGRRKSARISSMHDVASSEEVTKPSTPTTRKRGRSNSSDNTVVSPDTTTTTTTTKKARTTRGAKSTATGGEFQFRRNTRRSRANAKEEEVVAKAESPQPKKTTTRGRRKSVGRQAKAAVGGDEEVMGDSDATAPVTDDAADAAADVVADAASSGEPTATNTTSTEVANDDDHPTDTMDVVADGPEAAGAEEQEQEEEEGPSKKARDEEIEGEQGNEEGDGEEEARENKETAEPVEITEKEPDAADDPNAEVSPPPPLPFRQFTQLQLTGALEASLKNEGLKPGVRSALQGVVDGFLKHSLKDDATLLAVKKVEVPPPRAPSKEVIQMLKHQIAMFENEVQKWDDILAKTEAHDSAPVGAADPASVCASIGPRESQRLVLPTTSDRKVVGEELMPLARQIDALSTTVKEVSQFQTKAEGALEGAIGKVHKQSFQPFKDVNDPKLLIASVAGSY